VSYVTGVARARCTGRTQEGGTVLVITPTRRAPGALVLCRAVFGTGLSVFALAGLAMYVAGALRDNADLATLAPDIALGLGLWWGLPLGLVHGAAQLVVAHDGAPEDPASVARNAATAVAAVPVVALVLASAVDLAMLAVAFLAALHGVVVRRLAPRWILWRR
jgi:hypothetical protein